MIQVLFFFLRGKYFKWQIWFCGFFNFVRNHKIMATQASTFSAALEIFNSRYQDSLSNNSRRESDRFQSLQNQINSYFDVISASIGENNTTRAQTALDAIVAILVAEGISISEPVTLPLAVGIYPSPAVITVPVDSVGLNPVYTNALSTVYVFQGGVDASSSYTYTITAQNYVTAVIQNDNEIKINALTEDEGSVTISAERTDYGTLTFTIYVYRYYDAQTGISINTYPSNILIPTDYDGTNPVYTNAISTIEVRQGGSDETANWSFAIQSQTDVTAVIQNDNEVKINAIAADEGSVIVRCTRTGYGDQDITVKAYKYPDTQAGININTYPSTILIPADSDGSNPVYTDAISTQIVRDGIVDETSSYTFTIQAQTNVTAVIQNSDEVKINAITTDQGNVTVRASRTGYPDQDYEIPVQKQRKGSAVLDATTVDGETIKVNTSDEGYVARDSDGELAFFGPLPDMSSINNGTGTITPDQYIFKSTNIRRAPSTDTNNGFLSLKRLYNIESIDSVSSFTVGNFLIGPQNILEISEDDGYSTEQSFGLTSGTVGSLTFYASDGDLTSYYVIGQKVLVYVKYNAAETKGVYSYITGTITSSTFAGVTLVAFTTDFVFSNTMDITFSEARVAGHLVRCVSYTPYIDSAGVVGSYNNFIIGQSNFIRGNDNVIHGNENELDEAESNYIYGEGFRVSPSSASFVGNRGNILIGIAGNNSDDIIESHGNLIIENRNSLNPIQIGHSDSGLNVLVGNSNYIGTGLTGQTEGFRFNNLFGVANSARADYTEMFGLGGKSLTNGEIVLSSSDSPIQKSIFILEGSTSSTSPTLLKTLARAVYWSSYAENIQMANNTAFMGTMTLSSTVATGGIYMREERIQFSCDGSGNIINVSQESPGYTSIFGGTSGTITYGTGTLNEISVSVTAGAATATKWACRIEGIIMDV